MKKPAITFAVGAFGFIVIGLTHTYVHLTELSGLGLKAQFANVSPILVSGTEISLWDLFQGLSLLMGFFSIALGAILLTYVVQLPEPALPNAAICLITMALLCSIIFIGWLHLSAMQVFGGIFGLVCFGIPLLARRNLQ